jgi:hypothetical protein
MKKIILFLTLFTIASCHNKSTTKTSSGSGPEKINKVIVDPEVDMTSTGAYYKVDSLFINENILSVLVSYSGGCKDHSFQLFSDGMYAKSIPPQLSLSLKHIANDDQCKKIIKQELKFDVSDLKYKGNNTVILKIGNKKVSYSANK